jgi:prepilin-type N-terminal cleavage/methylation domain-containing protein
MANLLIKKQILREKGFSLVEVLVAIFIISLALSSVLFLLNSALLAGSTSSARLVAANLAQEGIEVVKNIRDLDFIASGSWDDWYSSFSGTNDYIVQYNDTSLRSFSDIQLKFNALTGLYSYDSGNNTVYSYKRRITLSKISNDEIKVTSLVTWTEKDVLKSISVEDRLWNWR